MKLPPQVRKELAAAELRNADFGSLNKAHENAIAESAGKMCCLQEKLDHLLSQHRCLQTEGGARLEKEIVMCISIKVSI